MIKNGVLITPCLTDSVLESITRDTVIKIARSMGMEVQERSIDRTELYLADEAFLCGSAMEITPIYTIDKYAIGLGTQGEKTKAIHIEYLNIVTGKDKKFKDWLTPIF